jgi:hypothetical protein
LSTTFFHEKPKKIIPHRYSEAQYTVMRETLAESMKSILALLILNKISKTTETVIKICFQTILTSIKYAFSTKASRPVQLYNKNFNDSIVHCNHIIEQFGWDSDTKTMIISKIEIVKQSYTEQIRYLTELEDQAQKEAYNVAHKK